jgi:hypothetical protein
LGQGTPFFMNLLLKKVMERGYGVRRNYTSYSGKKM